MSRLTTHIYRNDVAHVLDVHFRANDSNVDVLSATMIPRTSIEEANKHLVLLHKRVTELEKTVKEQHEALIAKDQFLQTKVTEISSAKNAELDELRLKLSDGERTMFVLQQQMEQKNRALEILQRNYSNLKSLLLHKTNVRLLLKAMEETEGRLIDDATESETEDAELASQTSTACFPKSFHAHPNGGDNFVNGDDENPSSSQSFPESVSVPGRALTKQSQSGHERRKSLRGKEFYL